MKRRPSEVTTKHIGRTAEETGAIKQNTFWLQSQVWGIRAWTGRGFKIIIWTCVTVCVCSNSCCFWDKKTKDISRLGREYKQMHCSFSSNPFLSSLVVLRRTLPLFSIGKDLEKLSRYRISICLCRCFITTCLSYNLQVICSLQGHHVSWLSPLKKQVHVVMKRLQSLKKKRKKE